MNGEQIIDKFELYVDDATELSSTEELALLNEKYQEICAERNWEFLKASDSGTLSTTVPYIDLPSDFVHLLPNAGYTENYISDDAGMAPVVVFVGSTYRPYRVVNWSDRRQYRDRDGFAYLDYNNARVYFTKQPTSGDSYELDYKSRPTDITNNTSPVFPAEFHPLLYLAMAIDDDIIQRYEKARSYAGENQAKFNRLFASMCLWNSQLQLN